MLLPLFLAAAAAFHAPHPPPSWSVSRTARIVATSAPGPEVETKSTPEVKPPANRAQMLAQASAAVRRAREAGLNRVTLRLFLPRDGELVPPDESWQGGVMQLFAVASPLVRDLLRALSVEIAGVPPALTEQRLDESGVDGESVWMAQSSQPEDDAVGFVQPSAEVIKTVTSISETAGTRPVLLVNPQWKERDDPLDALSRKGGFLGTVGSFLGGKAATEAELARLGFVDVYSLAEYRCRGSLIRLQLVYPYGWTAFYREGVTDEEWKPLIVGVSERPSYQDVEAALKENNVPFRLTEFDSIV